MSVSSVLSLLHALCTAPCGEVLFLAAGSQLQESQIIMLLVHKWHVPNQLCFLRVSLCTWTFDLAIGLELVATHYMADRWDRSVGLMH